MPHDNPFGLLGLERKKSPDSFVYHHLGFFLVSNGGDVSRFAISSPDPCPNPCGINYFKSGRSLPLLSHGRLSLSPSPLTLVSIPSPGNGIQIIMGQYIPVTVQDYRSCMNMPWEANWTLCVSSFYSARNRMCCPQKYRLIYLGNSTLPIQGIVLPI